MKRHVITLLAALLLASPAFAADPPKEKLVVEGQRVVELKDGGAITVDPKGHTYHVDPKGKRVRMRDGVVMEGKDGAKYLHKNDVIWKQITEKGTLAPNR
jgi:hypothetical protein